MQSGAGDLLAADPRLPGFPSSQRGLGLHRVGFDAVDSLAGQARIARNGRYGSVEVEHSQDLVEFLTGEAGLARPREVKRPHSDGTRSRCIHCRHDRGRRMAEPSPDRIVIDAIGPLITTVIGAAIGWLPGGLTGAIASPLTVLLTHCRRHLPLKARSPGNQYAAHAPSLLY